MLLHMEVERSSRSSHPSFTYVSSVQSPQDRCLPRPSHRRDGDSSRTTWLQVHTPLRRCCAHVLNPERPSRSGTDARRIRRACLSSGSPPRRQSPACQPPQSDGSRDGRWPSDGSQCQASRTGCQCPPTARSPRQDHDPPNLRRPDAEPTESRPRNDRKRTKNGPTLLRCRDTPSTREQSLSTDHVCLSARNQPCIETVSKPRAFLPSFRGFP